MIWLTRGPGLTLTKKLDRRKLLQRRQSPLLQLKLSPLLQRHHRRLPRHLLLLRLLLSMSRQRGLCKLLLSQRRLHRLQPLNQSVPSLLSLIHLLKKQILNLLLPYMKLTITCNI